MLRRNHIRWIAVVAMAVGLAAATAGAARRPHSALDEGEREGPRPEVETVVLRFVHIPVESFADTLSQLGEHPEVGEGLAAMPKAVNEAANAVVLIAPPEVADAMRRLADELDQPNEFLIHEREREEEELAWRMEMEERERALDREQEEFDLEIDRRRLDLERGMGPRPRGGVCDPDCRCPWRGTPRCRDAGRPCAPGCRCPRCAPKMGPRPRGPVWGPGAPCPPCPMPEKPCPKMGPPASGRPCPPPPPQREEAERHRREHLERIEDEQRRAKEMFDRHHREAEAHLRDIERKRHEIENDHRRRMEEFGDRLTPDQREAHERALRERMEDLERAREKTRRKVEEAHRRLEERLRELERQKHGMMQQPPGPKAGREKPPHAKAPRREPDRPRPRRRDDERPGPEGAPRRPGPMGPGLGRLLTPDGREALGLSDEQVERIENLVRRLRRHMEETFEGVRERLRRAGPEDRQHLLREMREKMAGRWGELRRSVMDRLAEILNPDQRERLKDWVRERGRGKRPGRGGFGPPGPPHKPHPGRGRGPHRPSALEHPVGCRLL
ncbi:MAG: hypothetical protein R6X20_01040 [Phycisphaerae bacterium]